MMEFMLADAIDALACPACRGDLSLHGTAVRCAGGHAFDVARQGYVSLLTGSAPPGTADTPAMVAARAEFLQAGHYTPLADRVRALVGEVAAPGPGIVLDAGAGTGYYLARALRPDDAGIALDVSKHALRRAARAHPRVAAVVADVWRALPVKDGRVEVVLDVFAPRNGPEFARVLRPGGTLVVVTPTSRHLAPLVETLGLLSVDEDKARRVGESLGSHFTEISREVLESRMLLDHRAVAAAAGMGPSAWHVDSGALEQEISRLPLQVAVEMSCHISLFRKIA
ncbi:ubiquinone biosynthesis protein [Sphaerisporangium krabiense]|uniref:23S rRNA (Guanine745-N1)-methyltransferase n=1 Tax=Sphaerisporangium krabiense TaxID=763782 RepID=A0A7W8Z1F9_9ACTN|nr:methyltransferase domain-containing protein [Sphaerisporangium krabiense]MBB5625677.1 23S rRNA (guanine745-N1)-methyltransferase [Sphaerisporangium krabiense]GII62987.1 ubiquinone biosynthesis protein [Sphaerisporangium krabiense]